MVMISNSGGGRFSALTSRSSRSQKPDTSSPARMLSASEQQSLREFATSRIKAGSVVVRENKAGRFVVSSESQSGTAAGESIKR